MAMPDWDKMSRNSRTSFSFTSRLNETTESYPPTLAMHNDHIAIIASFIVSLCREGCPLPLSNFSFKMNSHAQLCLLG